MVNIAYLALGSNIENRQKFLLQAIKKLANHECIKISAYSSIYETAPVGYENQDDFLNMVIKIETSLKPFELLNLTQEIELINGRKREKKWGPRTLDLDILLYNQENIKAEQLIVPHPRMLERSFVMVPLVEIDADVTIPMNEKPLSLIIAELPDREGVHLWKRKIGEGVFELFES